MNYREVITDNDLFDLADAIYWRVVEGLGIEDQCVEDDLETGGTKNTQKGINLYWTIEQAILDHVEIKND